MDTSREREKDGPLVLVVDDDALVAEMLRRALGRRGFRIEAVGTPDEAIERAGRTPYQAAVLDLVMPGRDGAELADQLRAAIPGLPVAMLTGYTHSPLLQAAQKAGARVFTKPVVIHELVEFLESAIG